MEVPCSVYRLLQMVPKWSQAAYSQHKWHGSAETPAPGGIESGSRGFSCTINQLRRDLHPCISALYLHLKTTAYKRPSHCIFRKRYV